MFRRKGKMVAIGGYGPVDTPCRHWWGERHKWSAWAPDTSSSIDGEFVRACTRCPWVEFGSTPELRKARYEAIMARLDAGEGVRDLLLDWEGKGESDEQAEPEG